MKLSIDFLQSVKDLDNYGICMDRRDPSLAQVFSIKDGQIESTNFLTHEHLDLLAQRGKKQIRVIFPKDVLVTFREKYPTEFPPPHYTHPLDQIRKKLTTFNRVNNGSKKKRKIFLAEDIYHYDQGGDRYRPIVSAGDEITPEVLKTLDRARVKGTREIDYRESEFGVLVYVPEAKNFKLKIDIFAVLAEIQYEIYNEDSPDDAFQVYREKQPKLVVLGHLASETATKQLYMYLEEYDPYCKILNYDESPSEHRVEEAKKIKKAYHRDYNQILTEKAAEEERMKHVVKQDISDEQKKLLMMKIRKIQGSGSVADFVDTWFLVRHLSKKFDLKSIEVLLKKLRKTLPLYQHD